MIFDQLPDSQNDSPRGREGLQGDKNETTESDNTARINERERETLRQRLDYQVYGNYDRHVRRCINCGNTRDLIFTVDHLGSESRMHFSLCDKCADYLAQDPYEICEKMESLSLAGW
jgi:hypothetical protein